MLRLFNFSEDFVAKLIELSVGKIPKEELETFISLSESELSKHFFTIGSESNLLRIIQAQFDIPFFLKECTKYPHQIEILISIANNSNYLTDILVRNPEYFFWVTAPSIINQKFDANIYAKSSQNIVSSYKTFEGKVNALRNFKRKEILRIGLRDIYLSSHLSDTTNELSDLANSISTQLFNVCFEQVLNKYQVKKPANKFVIISLGKLGGNELNYSSDIDLIAFYDKDSLINKKVYFNQILSEAILLFIESAGQKTGKGFLYRIDFRLRPDGRNAPLCGSYSEYLKYYEMRGEVWERQMLIKANYLCGSKSLFKKFYDYISRFIFHSSFDLSPLEQIKKIKISIEKRVSSDDNIKLASGGIRDIEFSVQALQLTHSKNNLELRTGNTISALISLSSKRIISEKERDSLIEAYIFFRKIEHYLQLMNDQQTHVIPAEGEIAEKLSYYLGFKEIKLFKQAVNAYRKFIREFYDSVFDSDIKQESFPSLDSIKFVDSKRSKQNIVYLQTGKNILEKKQFDSRTIESFQKIEPVLLEYLSKLNDPDLVLNNFVRVIRNAHYPQIWYDEFLDSKFFNLFLRLCEYSQKTIDLFAEDKFLRDEFLSRICLSPIDAVELHNVSLKTFLFRSAVQITAEIIQANHFPKLYTKFLTQKFQSIISDFVNDKNWKEDYFIAAMGSFGASELTFNSDIDLIFIVKGVTTFQNVQKDFQNLLKFLKDQFNPLQIDCRLRPEGKSSLLVWDIEDYEKYLANRARIWELQSLTKCKFLIGDKELFDEFRNAYIGSMKKLPGQKIKSEMKEMRSKLLPISDGMFDVKKNPGGLLDLDFLIGYFLLVNPEIGRDGFTDGLSGYLSNSLLNRFSDSDIKNLSEAYLFLKEAEIFNQTIFNTRTSKIPTDEKKLLKLAYMFNLNSIKHFNEKLKHSTLIIRDAFQKTFK